MLNAILGIDKNGEPKQHKGWVNHPATVMWRQYPRALAEYGATMCRVWIERGYNDSLLPKFNGLLASLDDGTPIVYPYWLGNADLHLSHQSNLLRKDLEFYALEFGDVPNDLPYVWFPEFELHLAI